MFSQMHKKNWLSLHFSKAKPKFWLHFNQKIEYSGELAYIYHSNSNSDDCTCIRAVYLLPYCCLKFVILLCLLLNHISISIYPASMIFGPPFRGLVRTGARGAPAPAEVWQRVRSTPSTKVSLALKTNNWKKSYIFHSASKAVCIRPMKHLTRPLPFKNVTLKKPCWTVLPLSLFWLTISELNQNFYRW